MGMVTGEEGIKDRLYRLADKFQDAYKRKQYALAMHVKFDASILMLTLMEKGNEEDEELIKKLFGYGNGPDEDEKGLFNRDYVQKAQWECIRQNISVPYIDEVTILRTLEIIK
jgi:hypothetical protein